MPNDLSHERMRFQTMNIRQLRTRLGKITDRQKLQNFIQMCIEYGYDDLRVEATRKLWGMDLGTVNINQIVQRVTPTAPPKVVVRTEVPDKREGIRVIKIKRR